VRRGVGVATGAALVLALQLGLARAAELVMPLGQNDIAAQLMLQLFGETSDSRASFAAAHGDRTSESPFRELALQVRPSADKIAVSSAVASAFGEARLPLDLLVPDQGAPVSIGDQFTATPSFVHFTVSPASSGEAGALVPPGQHFTVAYRPVPPQPAISPAPGTLAFMPPETHTLDFPAAGQIGSVSFEGHSSGDQQSSELPQLMLHDASANFDLRAGKRNLNLSLSSEYQQADRNFDAFDPSAAASTMSWQLPQGSAPLFLPNSTDLNRVSLGAGVSVPVVRGLTLNLNYDAQRLYGGYNSLPGLVNLDTVSNTYGGNLTFNIPRLSSSLSIGAYQDRFQDSILPISGQAQTREDVNFTVKF
jgi:hypothetical protein